MFSGRRRCKNMRKCADRKQYNAKLNKSKYKKLKGSKHA